MPFHKELLRIREYTDERELEWLLDWLPECGKNVFLAGESGTGKSIFAEWIHENWAEKQPRGRFITINLAAYPKEMAFPELFGWVKGAFTGADKDKKGLIELANHGTLFMDELGYAPLEVQSKLLTPMSHGKLIPLGSEDSRPVKVRYIGATTRPREVLFDLGCRFPICLDLMSLKGDPEVICKGAALFLNDALKDEATNNGLGLSPGLRQAVKRQGTVRW